MISPKQLKKIKKTTIDPKNNDNNCFKYALTAASNYQNIKSHLERVFNLKPFVDQYNWKEVNFPPHSSKNCKKIELENKKTALNILFVQFNIEKIRLAYKPKHNFKREN